MSKGSSLETVVLASQTLIRATKVPNGVKYLRGGRTVPTKGPVDFFGICRRTKRLVLFDAKQCDLAQRFPVGNTDHLPPHQRDLLITYGREGAIAGLLIEATRLRRYFWLYWESLVSCPPSYQWNDGDHLHDLGPTTHLPLWDRVFGPDVI